MSTIRFRELVKSAGRPEPKSLWSDPKHDRRFMQAVKQNRVLTIVQEPTSKRTDFGEIGFHQGRHASYFVFPKSLPANQGKVVGIKYDLVEEDQPGDILSAEQLKTSTKSSRGKKARAAKPEPALLEFNVLVRRVASLETTVSVRARTKTEAREQAVATIKEQDFDLSHAKIEDEIVTVK